MSRSCCSNSSGGGDGARGESGQGCRLEQLSPEARGRECQQDLAARGGMQWRELADPVVGADRRRAPCLIDVHRVMRTQHRNVDGLPDVRGEPLAYLAPLLGDVEATRDGIGQAQDAERRVDTCRDPETARPTRVPRENRATGSRRLVYADVGGDSMTPASPRGRGSPAHAGRGRPTGRHRWPHPSVAFATSATIPRSRHSPRVPAVNAVRDGSGLTELAVHIVWLVYQLLINCLYMGASGP